MVVDDDDDNDDDVGDDDNDVEDDVDDDDDDDEDELNDVMWKLELYNATDLKHPQHIPSLTYLTTTGDKHMFSENSNIWMKCFHKNSQKITV